MQILQLMDSALVKPNRLKGHNKPLKNYLKYKFCIFYLLIPLNVWLVLNHLPRVVL